MPRDDPNPVRNMPQPLTAPIPAPSGTMCFSVFLSLESFTSSFSFIEFLRIRLSYCFMYPGLNSLYI